MPDPYDYEERAAILEYEAGLTRDEAEREAKRQIEEREERDDEHLDSRPRS